MRSELKIDLFWQRAKELSYALAGEGQDPFKLYEVTRKILHIIVVSSQAPIRMVGPSENWSKLSVDISNFTSEQGTENFVFSESPIHRVGLSDHRSQSLIDIPCGPMEMRYRCLAKMETKASDNYCVYGA